MPAVDLFRRPKKWELAVSAALVIGALVLARFYGRWGIPQNGMFPTYPARSHLVAAKTPYRTVADVRRGDVVIFRVEKAGVPYDYVWRVVALPGERIAIHADDVVVNGRAFPRQRAGEAEGFTLFTEDAGEGSYRIALPAGPPDENSELAEVQVPDGHLFLLGDNRHNAVDSRTLGAIAFETILARVVWSW
jgi:signal peptidase I